MRIAPETIPFLTELAEHNNKEWFTENKTRYDAVWQQLKTFVAEVETGLNKTDVIESAKVFRIYRDVRFSKDKTPYKKNLGASFVRATAARRGGYYVHIEPNNSFVGGGFWAPESADLKRIREELAFDAAPLRAIIDDTNFKQHFGSLMGNEVKTAPRGFDKKHPNIDLIRKKQFLVMQSFSDEAVTKANFSDKVVEVFEAMRPFFDYMSIVLTTDANGELLI